MTNIFAGTAKLRLLRAENTDSNDYHPEQQNKPVEHS
jgi:hypothetical protein